MISNQDRFLLAFRRELMSAAARGGDHYARLYWDDRDAFLTAYHAAWAAGRPEPYASLARTLADAGDLSVKAAIRLAVRLNAAQRWREAEAALRDPRFRLLD
ncbi:MAG TPA: hypothetical protein VHB02_06820, partial [Acidimicrobiales bacterium]|nr:hypothetical protein [Acidimicrobiales bacterium]